MPDDNRTIQLRLKIDNTGAIVAVEGVGTSIDKTKEKVNLLDDSFARIGLRAQGMKQIFELASGTFGAWIRASDEGQLAVAKLDQALKTQGIYTDELVNQIKEYAKERQNLTGIDHDETIAIAGQLTAMGLQGDALKSAINRTQDLSVAMNVDLHTAGTSCR